jgi:hypothetical protein
MSSSIEIDFLGEGETDAAVARTLIRHSGAEPGRNMLVQARSRGKQSLDGRLAGLNERARRGYPVLVIRDFDKDAVCPGELVARLVASPVDRFCLRLAVRTTESWLMSDVPAMARATGVSEARFPTDVDAIDNPKRHFLDLVRAFGGAKIRRVLDDEVRRAVPDWALLSQWRADFAAEVWQPKRAAKLGRSNSLMRSWSRIQAFTDFCRSDSSTMNDS